MSIEQQCPACGTILDPDAPEKLCLKCLMGHALGGRESGQDTIAPENGEILLDNGESPEIFAEHRGGGVRYKLGVGDGEAEVDHDDVELLPQRPERLGHAPGA